MITEVPEAADFQAAGLNQMYLAWQIAMQAQHEYESIVDQQGGFEEQVMGEYWSRSQPALANAFTLIEQAMELALKARIISVSPFLLISRDPKDWPKGLDKHAVPFSDFRTLDAADLVTVINATSPTLFDEKFRSFWNEVRSDRNKIMHSNSRKNFDSATLVRTILKAAQALFNELTWSKNLLDLESKSKYASLGLIEDARLSVMQQIRSAIKILSPAESKTFFGYDPRRRSYVCPSCYEEANQDFGEVWPKLAQFSSKSPGVRKLLCVVCGEPVEVERLACTNSECKGDVIYQNLCLTCLSHQDDPSNFRSDFVMNGPKSGHRYNLNYMRGRINCCDSQYFPDDASASEHARLAMQSPHLRIWEVVTIKQGLSPFPYQSKAATPPIGLIGRWVRQGDGLVWEAGQSEGNG